MEKNVQRFLECGIFQQGFARVRCDGCDSEYLQAALGPGYTPGASFGIQTWGDPLTGHPHIHALVSDRAWTQDRASSPFGGIDSAVLTRFFSRTCWI